jgi:tetratricopeptide (TPR) repeat protein
VAAIEAAALLQVPAPPPVPAVIADTSRPAPGAMPPRAYVQTTEPAGPSNFLIVLWLLLLFAVQMLAIASNHAVPVKSIPELLTSSFMQYLLIALLCFAIIGLLGKALRGEFPSAAGPLLAMTLVYGLLLAKVFFMPESQSLQTASDVPAEQGKPLNLRDGNAKRDWYGFAIAYEDKRDWQGLLSVATEWTANEPGNVDPWIFKGIACAGLKLYAQAVEADLQASRMAPNNATVWANLASDYLSLGQPPEAEAAARKAVELDSNSAMAWNNLGASLRGEGTQDEAMADFQRAIAIDPSYSTAWGNVGGQYYRRKQYPEALDAYQKALALDPSSQTATVGIANVQEMQRLGGG